MFDSRLAHNFFTSKIVTFSPKNANVELRTATRTRQARSDLHQPKLILFRTHEHPTKKPSLIMFCLLVSILFTNKDASNRFQKDTQLIELRPALREAEGGRKSNCCRLKALNQEVHRDHRRNLRKSAQQREANLSPAAGCC